MRKITDPNYHLPEVLPFQWVRTLTSGANCPALVRGVELNSHTAGDFVLKYRGAERMDEAASRRELVAAWLAAELDIWTPEPVVLHLEPGFREAVPTEFRARLTAKALGLNVGSRFVDGHATFESVPMLASELLQSVARIFAFDLLIQNSDRRAEKPNSFLAEGRIYVYDHELAFGFLSMLPMFANPEPWILNATDVSAAEKHLFYPMLRQSKNVDWQAALSTLPNLTPQFWQRAAGLLPDEWKDAGELHRIRGHVESIQQNSQTFISEICKKLIG